jgi:hypothetical protein
MNYHQAQCINKICSSHWSSSSSSGFCSDCSGFRCSCSIISCRRSLPTLSGLCRRYPRFGAVRSRQPFRLKRKCSHSSWCTGNARESHCFSYLLTSYNSEQGHGNDHACCGFYYRLGTRRDGSTQCKLVKRAHWIIHSSYSPTGIQWRLPRDAWTDWI